MFHRVSLSGFDGTESRCSDDAATLQLSDNNYVKASFSEVI